MNVLDLAQKHVKLKKAASTHGGEWQGPCPACNGKDRFHVWPEQNNGQGGYWCRGCDKAGDAIQFLRDFEGKSYHEACEILSIKPNHRDENTGSERKPKEKPEFTPAQHASPADLWREKADKFITWAQENLKHNKKALEWLAARGINAWTAENFRLGWNPGEDGKDIYRPRKAWGLEEIINEKTGRPKTLCIPRGLVIPYIIDNVIHRIKIRRPQAHRTQEWSIPYYVLPGSSKAIMIIGRDRRAFVIVESELDAIACASACALAGAVALGTSRAKPDQETYAILKNSLQILNALDYDEAGAKAMTWWDEQFPDTCDRWPVPQGKDPGEAFEMGTDLGLWIKAGLPPALTISSDKPASAVIPVPTAIHEKQMDIRKSKNLTQQQMAAVIESRGLSPLLLELWKLLRNNPGVRIINNAEHFTVQRNGKYVGGRINHLVFREPVVTDYIMNLNVAEIDGNNLVN